jgi:hypothetical protein
MGVRKKSLRIDDVAAGCDRRQRMKLLRVVIQTFWLMVSLIQ